jgi:hypothetical protein
MPEGKIHGESVPLQAVTQAVGEAGAIDCAKGTSAVAVWRVLPSSLRHWVMAVL